MDYMSVRQAAEKWGVSVRQVQVLLKNDRIKGALRFDNHAWMIPADAQKPGDPRLEKKQPPQKSLVSELFEIIEATTLPMPFAKPDAILDSIAEERVRLQYEGELAYLRGDFERTKNCFCRTEGDQAARLRTCPAVIAAAISTGDYPFYLEIENYLKNVIQKSDQKNIIAFAEHCLSTAYVSAAAPNMSPEWLKKGDFRLLHSKAKPDAAYKRAKYFQCLGKFDSMLAVAETALGFSDFSGGIFFNEIYLRITCAAAYYALGQEDEAICWLLSIMELALPHGFITPFTESATAFGGLLEKILKRSYPAYYDEITNQWKRTFINWRSFHNHFTKDNITLILSLRDYQIARLAALGVPNKQIAEQFNMSLGRLKNKMSELYRELLISNREELEKVIL